MEEVFSNDHVPKDQNVQGHQSVQGFNYENVNNFDNYSKSFEIPQCLLVIEGVWIILWFI